MYLRALTSEILHWINQPEILILYGARQVGKTTLLKEMIKTREDSILLNCELPMVAGILENRDLKAIQSLFGQFRIICLDEAQRVQNIGSILKLIYDELPVYKIIATGSSSFELADRITEPLTGRNIKFRLYPLSLSEIEKNLGWLEVLNKLNELLIYGSYPGIIDLNNPDRIAKLAELSSDYLYRDILIYENVKHPTVIRNLLKALALQVGNQVSVSELSGMLGITRPTVEKYLDLLEKSFVIFRLPSYSRNLRNEIRKSQKIYFYDNGILNAITGNFSMIQNRSDAGFLWENFCMTERMKVNSLKSAGSTNMYFWRTYDGAEIDLIEETGGMLQAFEFKWNIRRKPMLPASFSKKYKVTSMSVVSPETLYLIKEN
ncbi:MAG: ATP-binding protein [Bacteroidales bacterium]